MKVKIVEVEEKGWDTISKDILYEDTIPVPMKGEIIYINNVAYKVIHISRYFYTDKLIENYVKVEVLKTTLYP